MYNRRPTRIDTARMIEVMQAYVDFDEIEMASADGGDWEENKQPCWDWSAYDYRVKPKAPPTEIIDKWVIVRNGGSSLMTFPTREAAQNVANVLGWAESCRVCQIEEVPDGGK